MIWSLFGAPARKRSFREQSQSQTSFSSGMAGKPVHLVPLCAVLIFSNIAFCSLRQLSGLKNLSKKKNPYIAKGAVFHLVEQFPFHHLACCTTSKPIRTGLDRRSFERTRNCGAKTGSAGSQGVEETKDGSPNGIIVGVVVVVVDDKADERAKWVEVRCLPSMDIQSRPNSLSATVPYPSGEERLCAAGDKISAPKRDAIDSRYVLSASLESHKLFRTRSSVSPSGRLEMISFCFSESHFERGRARNC